MAVLCLLNDDGAAAQAWEIADHPLMVGRSPNADVKIEDDGLSRRHFMILHEGNDYLIKDLGSRNGTWVGGDRAFIARLRHDDFIQAGRTRFRFNLHGSAEVEDAELQSGPHGTVVLPA
jgi:pSer/pThr/pTyr-binding forkhead associated (FHA) protein